MGFCVYRLVKVKLINTWVTKVKKVVELCTQACSCIDLMLYATLGAPYWFFPLVRQKAFEGFLLLLVVYFFGNPIWFFFGKYYKCVLLLGHKGQPQHAWLIGVTKAFHGN